MKIEIEVPADVHDTYLLQGQKGEAGDFAVGDAATGYISPCAKSSVFPNSI